ncbi:MAG: CoA transferase [Rhizobiales bacterium]|nr:CoA transferase [Hyphomicrobiales bacterium]
MRPLEGLRVVSLEQAVSAPYCTSRMADAGAEVIKVERPEGDFARGYDTAAGGQSSYFVWLNRGKQSIVLDLRQAEDRLRLEVLIGKADVFVQNLRPGALDRLGLPIATLRARHPRLVLCSITGYGEAGPLANRKAYDLLVQAESGLVSLTGTADAMTRVGFSIVDVATGLSAYAAILEALTNRERTGSGDVIDIAMFDVIAEWLTVPLLQHEAGNSPQRIGLAHPSIAPYGAFRSGDGSLVLIAVQNDREWVSLATKVLQRPDLAEDPHFATNNERVRNRALTDEHVASGLARFPHAELLARLDAAGIAFAEINDMAALSRHPHLRRITVATSEGSQSLPAPPAVFASHERQYGAVPAIGAHQPEEDGE